MNVVLFSGLILFVIFRTAYALQCYQCTHDLSNPNEDCIDPDIKYLQNCTNTNDATEQVTNWDCNNTGNYTSTTVLFVYRNCIPRHPVFPDCTIGGPIEHWIFFRCACNFEDGCNSFVPKPWGGNITSTPSFETTTPSDGGNGGGNLRLSSTFIVYSLLAYSLCYIAKD
ncbi:uncharacterized protein LOC119077173 [Bradysia coprophila]|uniref:uncharacterized protein LOC119077173 n=1 Tax=Bradysia coprophila TaxID=38358 RepID=UPI00187DB10D|nr:uncharacterized protein LOC119077173 [Bradysia coprophila]